ncbi:uncharacterized protein MELLADRAFT_73081 [Melampsora larici-populina 98AG31]|uniref:Uncharacterized protein n=1 Tax=Melampsora larici-populina (strain 98AG31 / pathotype 3-4-7) TaxID=747676 RepID=F4S2S2_MELLP|nr:uncharacterized protein MELLADRAFT_73081 [Melampsora larici-populina 98AG31]EGG01077.1 hypothetical protein MELLADRAFT_73081 [Melampsora larici-populina 98AG31]
MKTIQRVLFNTFHHSFNHTTSPFCSFNTLKTNPISFHTLTSNQTHHHHHQLGPITPSSIKRFSTPPLHKKIQKVLIVKKQNDPRVTSVLETVYSFFQKHSPEIEVLIEENDQRFQRFNPSNHSNLIDLIIALGGDGTVLHVASLFKNFSCPDILGFNLGTIGFLLPFPVEGFEDVLRSVLDGKVKREERMRLSCLMKSDLNHQSESNAKPPNPNEETNQAVPLSAVNEISLHRSQHPHMTPIHITIDGQFLTTVVADGLVVATPTGSTAYSCSAGGPIVHPAVAALLITPICPRSLSFRPLVVPADVTVELTLDSEARASAELALDGISTQTLHPGQSIIVRKSLDPIRLLSPGDGWVDDLNLMLNFNRSFASKSKSQDRV